MVKGFLNVLFAKTVLKKKNNKENLVAIYPHDDKKFHIKDLFNIDLRT